jgi:ABC-type Zn uptake system ZnuABC Zn-binding protein ZnuA
MKTKVIVVLLVISLLLTACRVTTPSQSDQITVLAIEPFLADLAQNIAGDRVTVQSLIPLGLDPHAFEATPQDVTRLNNASILILNGAGLEESLKDFLDNTPANQTVIIASAGLTPRTPQAGEPTDVVQTGSNTQLDPHFWLNPLNVITYVENIRDGLINADPAGSELYKLNAENYISILRQLDGELQAEIEQIPRERRLLVTNHESFGYFADRYGLRIIGAIIPSVSTGSSPSAQDLAKLADAINASGAPAVFLETGSNPSLANQIAVETGVKVVTDLYTHSLSAADGPAATYLDMMRHDTRLIVEALK